MLLTDLDLRLVYNSGNCADLVTGLYEPLLARAVRYDRTTYTFSANGLRAAAAGTVGLVRNGGRIRLICDCSVDADLLQAIRDGQLDAETVLERTVPRERLLQADTADITDRNDLELAYWLVANGVMEVKVAIGASIFHAKCGIVEDAQGNRVAFSGSLNETLSGWRGNWESLHVLTDRADGERLEAEERMFRRLWDNQAPPLVVIDLPEYFRNYIVERAPEVPPQLKGALQPAPDNEAHRYWRGVYDTLAADPDSTVATIPASLWPHQERFRQQSVGAAAVRRLIADEVGLGKTMQAGVLLKTRLNQGRAGRALVIAPKAATKQWQDELLMKFAIDTPVVDAGGSSYRDGRREATRAVPWDVPLAIVGHQWLVRNAERFLSTCGQYDLVIVDEAHRARFREVDSEHRRHPNKYLDLLRQLARATKELLLLTATPMQLHEVELWALFELLEPEGWSVPEYERFYRDEAPDLAEWKYRRDLLGRLSSGELSHFGELRDHVLTSDNDDYINSALADPDRFHSTLEQMEQSSPAKRLMSRHTRELLRQYNQEGLLDAPIPRRNARDIVVTMTNDERQLYDGITELVGQCYRSRGITRQALGFVTTVFRKRMGSSTHAYAQTLRKAVARELPNEEDLTALLDDADLDEAPDRDTDILTKASNVAALIEAAERAEQLSYVDSKRQRLAGVISELRNAGHQHILMFTQFRDTQKWLSEHLRHAGHYVAELYGQDSELGDRGPRLAEFREQRDGILLCTETASESLNLQFCSAVVSYDIPWNPMTLEQRAGRIDRIGQPRPEVQVVNMFYHDTAEHDAYEAVARRFEEIKTNVGEYPPIIAANIQRIIRDGIDAELELDRLSIHSEFDINRLNARWSEPIAGIRPQVTMADLEKPLHTTELMPAGWSVESSGGRHWDVTDPGGRARRVTTDPESYQNADGRLTWWAGPRGW